jgi:glycosyltransferase involved in cell wall biosynthesis
VSSDQTIILFLARLHPVKGLEYLIPALGQMIDQRFTFVLAGNGDPAYEQDIQRLLISTGIHARTYSVGFVSGEMKDLLLQGADLFVLTSHSENFGIAALESLAAGVPVLITPGVPLASLVQQHQLGYVAQLDSISLAAALRIFFAQRCEIQEMGQRAQQFILAHYTWDRIVAQFAEVYAAILN